ncbi:MAG TPA: hypothetical protein VJ731_14100 [Terriglobales bacterium]|nr:hypothetical protein [Terriglobales bacterium]
MTKTPQPRKAGKRAARLSEQDAADVPVRDTPLNFKVSAEFRRDFKTFAAQNNMKLYELLYESFAALKSKHAV